MQLLSPHYTLMLDMHLNIYWSVTKQSSYILSMIVLLLQVSDVVDKIPS